MEILRRRSQTRAGCGLELKTQLAQVVKGVCLTLRYGLLGQLIAITTGRGVDQTKNTLRLAR